MYSKHSNSQNSTYHTSKNKSAVHDTRKMHEKETISKHPCKMVSNRSSDESFQCSDCDRPQWMLINRHLTLSSEAKVRERLRLLANKLLLRFGYGQD